MSFSLGSDNHSGIHPTIAEAIMRANVGHAHSYGMDEISNRAMIEWRRVLARDAEVFYVFNGTAANVLSLQALLKSFEAVACSEVAHLHMDEAGAPEKFLGSKIYTLPSKDGRIFPEQLKDILARGGDQHFAQLKAVSLTLPTELGVCYSLEELKDWRTFADQHQLLIHWDGARIVNAAAFFGLSIADLLDAGKPDALSFGGTKNGLMGAEAVILFDRARARDFRYIRKQGLQLSSKTRFLAAQFDAYLTHDLWKSVAVHVTTEARRLAAALQEFPEIKVCFPVQSNGLFVSLPKPWIKPLKQEFFFYIWDTERNMARWMISFDWTSEVTEKLLGKIREVKKKWPV
jgi:threonine aldolase